MNISASTKWICEYCTYENYQNSIKCTMCRSSKPFLLNEDIFSLSPSTQSSNESKLIEQTESPVVLNPESSIVTEDHNKDNSNLNTKWSCKQCTYLNWPPQQYCVKCTTKRDNFSSDLSDDLLRLNFRVTPTSDETDLTISSSNYCKTNSPLASSSNLAAASLSNECSKKTEMKWHCSVCTYDNYPKSMRCSMCGTTKESHQVNKYQTINCEDVNEIDDLDGARGASNFCTHSSPSSSMNASKTIEKNNMKNLPNNYENTASSNLINNNSNNNASKYQLSNELDAHQDRRVRSLRRSADWTWLNACIGVVENNFAPVENYLARGGSVTRSLTPNEVLLLNRSSAFDVGHTLIHMAIRFHREELLPRLLAQISSSSPSGIKCVPSYIASDLATDIRRHFTATLRIRKAPFNCHYVNEHATFSLPSAEIEEFPLAVQEQLYDEFLDRDAQKQLESAPPALNWSLEITSRLGSRLMVLWNRSAGDCLLDSAMQATWGIFDRENLLRRALSDSLHQCGNLFYPRWKEYEMIQAALLHFTLEEAQWEEDWASLLSLASQPGASLEQLHIFVLAHIFRRPIIVYGVKNVKSFRGEDIGYARFEGVYLPLLWEQSFCIRSPIALGYTRGHFSALVPSEPYSRLDSAREEEEDVTYLPLMDCEMKLIPIHFLTQSEMGNEETMMRHWLDVCFTEGGILVAQQKLQKRPLLVAQMLEEWLNHYRRIAQVIAAPYSRQPQLIGYLSDGDTDEE